MTRRQRQGVVLILIGLAFPLVTLFFATDYDPRQAEIVLVAGKDRCGKEPDMTDYTRHNVWAGLSAWKIEQDRWDKCSKHYTRRTSVILPYRYVFAAGVIALFLGIGMVILNREPKSPPPSA